MADSRPLPALYDPYFAIMRAIRSASLAAQIGAGNQAFLIKSGGKAGLQPSSTRAIVFDRLEFAHRHRPALESLPVLEEIRRRLDRKIH